MFSRKNIVLLVIDIQGQLAKSVVCSEMLLTNARILISSAKILNIPIIVTEQYPNGLGPTVPELKSMLSGVRTISKQTFSCCREPEFIEALEMASRKQILITGIETHVCVFQTAADLIEHGYEVQVLADAVSSRTEANKRIGLDRVRAVGATISSVETSLFELLETSTCPEFKQVLRLVK